MRKRVMALALATAISTLVVPGPAQAVPIPIVTSDTASDQAASDQAAADWMFVKWLSVEEPRPAVRSAARGALLSDASDAITAFIASGYPDAIDRAETARQRNVDFTTRMVGTHAPEYYPRVNAAGRWALAAGNDQQLANFVATDYKAALARDLADLEHDGEQAAAIRLQDRVFVTRLHDEDPGEQVQAWAGRAVADGTTDADVVEFLRYGWVSASGLDRQKYRSRLADQDQHWRALMSRLLPAAEAAEKAARETAGEAQAQAQARAVAARAWGEVSAEAGPARTAWAAAEQVALRQADTWLAVQQAAATANSSNWLEIAGSAQGTQAAWAAERENAALQASSWTALYQQALAAEAAMTDPTA